jgi:hypothetical protein
VIDTLQRKLDEYEAQLAKTEATLASLGE